MNAAVEVLGPDQRTLEELAATINREHAQVQEAVKDAVRHAVIAGEALLQVREQFPGVGWTGWAAENVDLTDWTIKTYIRLARYKDIVLNTPEISTITQARSLIAGLPPAVPRLTGNDGLGYGPEIKAQAKALRSDGLTFEAIAETLGIGITAVRDWTQPGYQEARRSREERRKKRRRQERRALAETEREEAIKTAVRKAGGAKAEAYAMAERFQDVIAQAHREAANREERQALSRAGEYHRKMRDEIVRALGVS